MVKVKMSKADAKIKHLERLIIRREKEIESLNRQWKEAITKIEHRNKLVRFQIESIRKGDWPL